MKFELVYCSSMGNRNYWTTEGHFTKKDSNHRQWGSIQRISEEFPQLKFNHPTLFANKRIERFYCLDIKTKNLHKMVSNKTSRPPVAVQETDYDCPLKLKDKKYYAIAINVDDKRYYFNTVKGQFFEELDDQIRRWKELDKAIATASSVRTNKKIFKKILAHHPELNLLDNYVIDLRDGTVAWPSVGVANDEVNHPSNDNNPVELLMILESLQAQLEQHFSKANQFPVNDFGKTKEPLAIDFERFSAQKTFEAISYLVTVMSQKRQVDRILRFYDQDLLQDYLHTIELADLENFDANGFTRHLQQIRVKRRQVKNLALILEILANNMDLEAILKQLQQEPSLKNQYHFRHNKTGELLLRLLNPKISEIGENTFEESRGGEDN